MHLGPDEVLVAAKVAMPPSSSLAEVAAAIDAAEARVRAAEPTARVIYLEPDVDRDRVDRRGTGVPTEPADDRRAGLRLIELDNPIRDYAWGSADRHPATCSGIEPTGRPAAELWIGAHPDSPSRWAGAPGPPGLDELIAADPSGLLGPATVPAFGPRLPFLLKVLAAERALSIQVHPEPAPRPRPASPPSRRPACRATGPSATTRDANHKPELAYALTEFEAFCGFRPVAATAELLDALGRAGAGRLPGRCWPARTALRAAFTDAADACPARRATG